LNRVADLHHQTYAQKQNERKLWQASALSPEEEAILSRARPYDERNAGYVIWLRTHYGPGSDDVFEAVMDSASGELPPLENVRGGDFPEAAYSFSNAARYDYGDDWQRVFGRMPQLLGTPSSDYEEKRSLALAQGQKWERRDKKQILRDGGDWPEDAWSLGDMYNRYHLESQVGVIFVLDKETLGPMDGAGEEAGQAPSRRLLAAWYDAYGKTVRWRRMTAREAAWETSVMVGEKDDMSVWTQAEIGEDYDWDGPDGPPAIEDDEEGLGSEEDEEDDSD
jgi:hypothetical protein